MSPRAVLRTFSGRGDAEIVREMLLSQGIETFVLSDDCGSVDPALSFGRGVQLLVDEAELEQARRIVDEIEASIGDEPSTD